MRRITANLFITLDGVIQGPGGPTEDPTGGFDEGGWVFKVWDAGADEAIGSIYTGSYDLLLGRRTYDIFSAYWPYVEGEAAAMGDAFTRAGKHVLTRGHQSLAWENSHRLADIDAVAALKASDGPDLVMPGSGTIVPQLLAAGLIDRLMLLTCPLTLGKGKRLFGDGTPTTMLRMIDHKVTPKGTVIATYEPGGALPALPAEDHKPSTSAREVERQRRMQEGNW